MHEHELDLETARCESRSDEGRSRVSYSIRCADAGTDCPGSFTTETKDELVKHVELHAKEAHPGLELTSEQIDGLVKVSD